MKHVKKLLRSRRFKLGILVTYAAFAVWVLWEGDTTREIVLAAQSLFVATVIAYSLHKDSAQQ